MVTATADFRRMFIEGKWCEADDGRTLGVVNPATEEVLSDVVYGGRAETQRALQAAQQAMPGWMKLSASGPRSALTLKERHGFSSVLFPLTTPRPLAWKSTPDRRASEKAIGHSLDSQIALAFLVPSCTISPRKLD